MRLSVTSHNRGQGQYTPVSKTTDHDSAVRLIKSAQFQMRLWGRREVQYALVRLYCGRKYLFFFIHKFGFWTKCLPQEAENAAKVEIRAPAPHSCCTHGRKMDPTTSTVIYASL